MAEHEIFAHYGHMPPSADTSFHAAGVRAPGESVYDYGVDVTDIAHPDDWPDGYRSIFYDLGWRPWTPPGAEPVWWSVTDQRDQTGSPIELADAQGPLGSARLAEIGRRSVGSARPKRPRGRSR